MKSKIWVTSDTHYNHENIIKYSNRPFKSLVEMNETLVQNWNKVVKPEDKVYHLGDVYFGKRPNTEWLLSRLNGKKRLILGNHDNAKDQTLIKYFQKIVMWRHFHEYRLLLTHVPVHPLAIRTRKGEYTINVHGHTHDNGSPPGPYKSVCVEMTNYTPVNIEELIP